MFFIIIERLRKIFKQSVYILSRNREQFVQASEYIFCFSANVWLLLGVFQRFLRNGRLILNDIIVRLLLKENVQLIFFVCVAASRNISMIFYAADINDCFWKKKCAAVS